MSARAAAAALAALATLAGCGLKGPLYLPEKSKEVVIRPAPGSEPEAPAGTPPEAAAPPAEPGEPQARPPGSDRG